GRIGEVGGLGELCKKKFVSSVVIAILVVAISTGLMVNIVI
ncbi:permease, partial [Staphylococcus epidermidis]